MSVAPLDPPPAESTTTRLERLLATAPSAVTLAELEDLEASLESMDADDRLRYAAACKRQASAAEAKALGAAVLATTPGRGCRLPEDETHTLESELAALHRRTIGSLQAELAFARWLTGCGPVIFTLLCAGEVLMAHARVFDDETGYLDPEVARKVDAEVSPRAATLVPAAYRKLLRQAIAAADPDAASKRHQRAKRRSGVRVIPDRDGMSILQLLMATTDAIRAVDYLNALADAAKTGDDPRSHGMRQTDALLDALRHSLDHAAGDVPDHDRSGDQSDGPGAVPGGADGADSVGGACDTDGGADHSSADDDDAPVAKPAPVDAGPSPSRRRWWRRGPEIRVTIDWQTLMGWRNLPAELDGHGPIPAEVARALAREPDTTFRRLVYDPITGVLLDYGTKRYTADAHLRGLLEARDTTCRFPGCQRAAWWCDTEHCTPHDHGGATSCANCGLMCRRHHNHKTHDGFGYSRPDPATGETIWTFPNGFTYRQAPARYTPTGTDPGDTHRIPPPPRRGAHLTAVPPTGGSDPPF